MAQIDWRIFLNLGANFLTLNVERNFCGWNLELEEVWARLRFLFHLGLFSREKLGDVDIQSFRSKFEFMQQYFYLLWNLQKEDFRLYRRTKPQSLEKIEKWPLKVVFAKKGPFNFNFNFLLLKLKIKFIQQFFTQKATLNKIPEAKNFLVEFFLISFLIWVWLIPKIVENKNPDHFSLRFRKGRKFSELSWIK